MFLSLFGMFWKPNLDCLVLILTPFNTHDPAFEELCLLIMNLAYNSDTVLNL